MNIKMQKKNPAWGAIKKYLPFVIFLFYISFIAGVLFVNFYPEAAQESFFKITEAFSFLFELGPLEIGLFIFFNNLIKVFLFMILGVLFAIPTIFFLMVNGWTLGYVAGIMYPHLGGEGLFLSLFFHGIFELAALFIGAAVGVWFGVKSYNEVKRKKLLTSEIFSAMKSSIFSSFNIFLYVITPLLLIAAIIETIIIFYT